MTYQYALVYSLPAMLQKCLYRSTRVHTCLPQKMHCAVNQYSPETHPAHRNVLLQCTITSALQFRLTSPNCRLLHPMCTEITTFASKLTVTRNDRFKTISHGPLRINGYFFLNIQVLDVNKTVGPQADTSPVQRCYGPEPDMKSCISLWTSL